MEKKQDDFDSLPKVAELQTKLAYANTQLRYFTAKYDILCALEAAGVRNWEGYDHAMEILAWPIGVDPQRK